MIGPDFKKLKGGMSTVIKNYIDFTKGSTVEIIPISTVSVGGKIKKSILFINSYLKGLYFLLIKDIDIVHVHMASRTSFYRKALYIKLAKFFKKKIVIHLHGGEFDKFYWQESTPLQREKISYIFNSAHAIIALGDIWEKRIQKYCDTKVCIIPNGVETNNKNLYNEKSNTIAFLGRLEQGKGIFDLLEVSKNICEKYPNIKFVLGGSGDEEAIKQIINEYNLREKVILKGWLSKKDIDSLLEDTLIYFLPSYNEALPVSILEAMSFGIPIISTNVGSIPELVINDENGIITQPGDINEMIKAFEYLIPNNNIRLKISDNNYNKINACYSIKQNIQKLIEIYEDL